MLGYTSSSGLGGYDVFFVKADKTGNVLWQKTFGGTNIDLATYFFETSKRELIIVGESQSNSLDVPSNKGGNDLWAIKLK
jgi:hypothetical protein